MKNRLLIVDDDAKMLQEFLNSTLHDLPDFDVVAVGSIDECIQIVLHEKFEVVLLDLHFGEGGLNEPEGFRALPYIRKKLPKAEIIIHSGDGGHDSIAKSMALGATSYLTKHHYSMTDIAHKIRKAIERIIQRRESAQEGVALAEKVGAVFSSKGMQNVFTQAAAARRTSGINVYIHGPTGVGKELVAQAIGAHDKKAPFIAINCATIGENLVESELFGHEKGAFTSAQVKKIGKFELANGGTLFLDEIGCLSRRAQESLLRVVQNGEFTRVGGTATVKVSVRVICATNDDLEAKISSNEFRSDLYERLAACKINIPSLHERREDIRPLAQHFLRKYGREGMMIDPTCMSFLESYSWPRNVRELENVIKQMTVNCSGLELEVADLPIGLCTNLTNDGHTTVVESESEQEAEAVEFSFSSPYGIPLDELADKFAAEYISQTADKMGPDRSLRKLAKVLKITYGSLHRRLAKYGGIS